MRIAANQVLLLKKCQDHRGAHFGMKLIKYQIKGSKCHDAIAPKWQGSHVFHLRSLCSPFLFVFPALEIEGSRGHAQSSPYKPVL